MCLCSVDSFLEAFGVRSGLKWQSKLLLASTLWAARFSIKGIVLISANRYTLHIIVSEYLGAHPDSLHCNCGSTRHCCQHQLSSNSWLVTCQGISQWKLVKIAVIGPLVHINRVIGNW